MSLSHSRETEQNFPDFAQILEIYMHNLFSCAKFQHLSFDRTFRMSELGKEKLVV